MLLTELDEKRMSENGKALHRTTSWHHVLVSLEYNTLDFFQHIVHLNCIGAEASFQVLCNRNWKCHIAKADVCAPANDQLNEVT